jgi:hypothetical protein
MKGSAGVVDPTGRNLPACAGAVDRGAAGLRGDGQAARNERRF